jgi:hypothetical protein
MANEFFIAFTSPSGGRGFVRVDRIIAFEESADFCDDQPLSKPFTGIKLDDTTGTVLQAVESAAELSDRLANG